jgi:hypothetical protein
MMPESSSDLREDYVQVELPVWMVRQLRGKAREDARRARTAAGRNDAERIASLLTYCLKRHYE